MQRKQAAVGGGGDINAVAAAIDDDDDEDVPNGNDADAAPRYEEITTSFGGLFASICAVDWGSTMDAVATDVQDRHDNVYVVAAHACYVAQRLYAEKGGELTHGGGLEALAVLAKNPELVHTDRAGDSTSTCQHRWLP